MTAIGVVLFVCAVVLAPFFDKFDLDNVAAAVRVAGLVGFALILAGVAILLWRVMP